MNLFRQTCWASKWEMTKALPVAVQWKKQPKNGDAAGTGAGCACEPRLKRQRAVFTALSFALREDPEYVQNLTRFHEKPRWNSADAFARAW